LIAASTRRRLKVLHIDPEREWGGGEEQVLGLITHLTKKGHDNHLIADGCGRLFERTQALRIKTFPMRIRNDLDVRSVPALRKLIFEEGYDIVHCHTKRAHALFLWLPRGRRRPKYVVTRRMDYPEPNNWYTHLLYNRRVDGIVAVSRMIAEGLAHAGVEENKIRFIPSGVEIDRFRDFRQRLASESETAIVGTAAILEERKGHRYLLEAVAALKKQGVPLQLRIAGDGSLRENLVGMAHQLGISHDVEFLGFVSDIPGFLSSIDIFVLPSLFEGLGVSLLEAMAAGKPVVATRVGGIVNSVIDGVTGLLVQPRDVDGLAAGLRKLIQHGSLAAAMGRRGIEHVRENFTMEQMAEKNEACYYALLDGA
jgi:glycosyltransferase involved in cell wall biosynthesis